METNLIRIAPLAMLLSACSAGGEQAAGAASYATGQLPTAASVQQQTDAAQPAEETSPGAGEVAVGRALSSDGAIPETERTDQFARGEQIHVAVPVTKLMPQARVRVAWFGPSDDLLAEDTTQVPEAQENEYVSFSMPAREDFDPGEYRAEIWMDDEKIDEQHFAVVSREASVREQSSGG